MALIQCSECSNEVSTTTSQCPKCGSKKPFKGKNLTADESKGMTLGERRSFQKGGGKLLMNTSQKVSLVFIIAVIVVWVKIANAPLTKEEAAEKEHEDQIKSARATCKYEIKKRLHDPDSIEWGYEPLDQIVLEEKPGQWMVQLTFRAKNKFGALVLGKQMCELSHDGKHFNLLRIQSVK